MIRDNYEAFIDLARSEEDLLRKAVLCNGIISVVADT